MKITVLKILNSILPLRKLNSIDLPIELSLKLTRVTDEVDKVLAEFEKRRVAAKAEFAETPKKGGDPVVPKAKQKAFDLTVDKIAEEQIDLEITKISLTVLISAEVKLSSSDLKLILWAIEEDTEKTPG
jgi:hypothetical protein